MRLFNFFLKISFLSLILLVPKSLFARVGLHVEDFKGQEIVVLFHKVDASVEHLVLKGDPDENIIKIMKNSLFDGVGVSDVALVRFSMRGNLKMSKTISYVRFFSYTEKGKHYRLSKEAIKFLTFRPDKLPDGSKLKPPK